VFPNRPEHIRARRLEAAIVAPVYFMENALFGVAQLRKGVYGSPLLPTRRLMQVGAHAGLEEAARRLTSRSRNRSLPSPKNRSASRAIRACPETAAEA
jgi:hypothetical protein